MIFKTLDTPTDLPLLIEESANQVVLLFKHSTRCSISSMALSRFERAFAQSVAKDIAHYYMIKVVEQRPVSNLISTHFSVEHQSPQVLLIYKGSCIYSVSHNGINYQELCAQASKTVL